MKQTPWTTAQILGLAPDRFQVKATENIVAPQKWLSLGADDLVAWGEFPNNNKIPYRVQVLLPDLILACTCATPKLPCRHSLSLLLLHNEQPNLFTVRQRPFWVSTTCQSETAVISPNSSTHQQRLNQITAGMHELSLWLRDMVFHGLAELPAKPARYWTQMLDRLIDARADATANELRDISRLPGKKKDWPDELLRRVSRLYLLTQAFQRFHTLTPAAQSDLYAAVGWSPALAKDEGEYIQDEWLILGRQYELIGQEHHQRVWLWGSRHKRHAFLQRILQNHDHNSFPLFTGAQLSAALHFRPSRRPLQAKLTNPYSQTIATSNQTGHQDIMTALHDYAVALAANPWLQHYPLLLQTTVKRHNDHWFVSDQQGASLPMPDTLQYGWHLLALQQQQPLTLFGEWNGRYLTPLAIHHDNQWLDLHILRGVA